MDEGVPNYYARLGVSPSASRKEIERAFRRRAKETHPDQNPDDPTAAARFRRIRKAHEVLTDPERRAAYDARRRARQGSVPSVLTASSVGETGCVTYYLPRVAVGLIGVVVFMVLEAFGVWQADPVTVVWGLVGASAGTGVLGALLFWLVPDTSEDYAVRFTPDDVCVWYEQQIITRIRWTAVVGWTLDRQNEVLELRVDPGAVGDLDPVPPVLSDVMFDPDAVRLRLDLAGTDVRASTLRRFLHEHGP